MQSIIPMGDQGAMRLTTARYYTPLGRSIQAKGVTPDIRVEQATLNKVQQRGQTRERDLRGALDTKKPETPKKDDKNATPEKKPEAPKSGDGDAKKDGKKDDKKDGAGKTAKTAPASKPIQDYQLSRAVDLLRGLALIRARTATTK